MKKDELNRFTQFRITMLRPVDLRTNRRLRTKLLFELAHEGLLKSLPWIHFSAGKLPHHRKRSSALALANQQLAFSLNQGGDNRNHRHLRRAVAIPLRKSASGCIARKSARAPSASGGPGVLRSSSRITTTRLAFTAGTFCHASFRSALDLFIHDTGTRRHDSLSTRHLDQFRNPRRRTNAGMRPGLAVNARARS